MGKAFLQNFAVCTWVVDAENISIVQWVACFFYSLLSCYEFFTSRPFQFLQEERKFLKMNTVIGTSQQRLQDHEMSLTNNNNNDDFFFFYEKNR